MTAFTLAIPTEPVMLASQAATPTQATVASASTAAIIATKVWRAP